MTVSRRLKTNDVIGIDQNLFHSSYLNNDNSMILSFASEIFSEIPFKVAI